MIKLYVMFTERLRSLRDREEGQALVEYALILGLVSVVAIAALTLLGDEIGQRMQDVVDAIDEDPAT